MHQFDYICRNNSLTTMLRDLIKEGGLYTIANLLTKGVSLLLIPFYSEYFTQAEYGILAMLGIFGALGAAIFSFQIYQGVGRYISEKGVTLQEQQRIGSTGFWFTLLTYSIFLIIGFTLKDQVIKFLSEEETIKTSTYILSLLAIFVYGLFNALGVQLKFLRQTKAYSLTMFLQAILNIALILFLALVMDMRIDSVYMASLIITPLIMLLQLYYLRDYIILYIGRIELKKLVAFSTPMIPAALAYLILNFTDRVFIKEMTYSLAEVGIYDMAFKFSSILSIVIMSFQSALAPIIFEKHAEDDTQNQLGRIFRLFIAVGTMGTLLLAFFSYETLYIFTQPNYYSASILMPIFYLSVIISGIGLFSPGLHIMNKTKYYPFIVIFAGIVNIILNYLLIPIFGLLGAAIATLISVLVNNIILFIVSQKLYPLPFPKDKSLIVLSVFIPLFMIGSYIDQFIAINYVLLFFFKIVLLFSYLWFLIQFNFINLSQITNRIFRKK
ncbi:oligosaccharide flippase family protein [Crocinitomix catalasitica]|uniref:oligosaccharide flippase family protein n=1 Tax=Crocinitomix catalasitica TaxID=184607 RepID=UPI000A02A792|nr:polysaccharide biosynthesis C-terminal domain-containing protein [Crocinitomix catalasitica]